MSCGRDAICTTLAAARRKSLQLQALLWSFWGCIWQLAAKKMAADAGKLQKQLRSALDSSCRVPKCPKIGFRAGKQLPCGLRPLWSHFGKYEKLRNTHSNSGFSHTTFSHNLRIFSQKVRLFSPTLRYVFSPKWISPLCLWISPLCFWISPLCFEFLRLVNLEVLLSGILKSILGDMGWKGRLPPFRHCQVLWTPHVHTAFQ